MGRIGRNTDFAVGEQQRCIPVSTSAKSIQHLFYLLWKVYNNSGIAVFKIFIWGGISSDIYHGLKFSFMLLASRAVKYDFRMYMRRYTSTNENFEYGDPHSNALLQFRNKLEH